MTVDGQPPLADDETLVDLRCSVVVLRGDEVLLIRRGSPTDDRADWVLPGGRPADGESMAACARREALEETGLRVSPTRCAFVGEVIDPRERTRIVELIFLASLTPSDHQTPTVGEPGMHPEWMHLTGLPSLNLRPPIAGYLPALTAGTQCTAPYLGNLWRPPTGTGRGNGPPGER